ncbi:unnamed protein product [Adineta steineri]|uniref:NHL repeat containing protein-like protein n=1 Tax=Adineta steineri TaxID=433720 RepID=A0A818ZJV2_9BILA|nr:unnamed protein product [Adineta steineri]
MTDTIIILCLMYSKSALSFNQPKFCPTATWNSNGITIGNQSIVGQYFFAIFMNTDNTIYVANQVDNTIVMWQEENVNSTKIISGNFVKPNSLFVTSNGDIYIDDGVKNGRVQKWSEETNIFVTVMNVSSRCDGLFVDVNDTLYCSMPEHHQVVKRSLSNSMMNSNRVAAGTGIYGSASNQFHGQHGIYVDVNLDLYVADCENHRVQLFQSGEPNGITVAGSKSLNPTITLRFPTGVILDAEKYLFIVDRYNHRIVGSDVNGFRCLVGCYGMGSQSNQLNKPFSLSFDHSGNMFVTDQSNHRIQKFLLMKDSFTLPFNQPKFCPTATWNPTGINFANQSIVGQDPFAIFVSTNNTIYAANQQNSTIITWQEENINSTKILTGNFTEPWSLFVTTNGDIYIDDGFKNGRVQKWSVETNTFATVMNVNSLCSGLFVDIDDTLYCSMPEHHQVVKRSLNDSIVTPNRVAAGTDSLGSAPNQLYGPAGIFVDVNLDLYVADYYNDRVQLFQSEEPNGITVAGSGSLNSIITLVRPTGVILDAEKYLYIVDSNNHRIVASGLNGFRCLVGCDEEGSQSNQLNNPYSFSFDRSGNMFVTDQSNHRIQKFKYLKRYCVNTFSVIQKTYSSSLTNNNQMYYRDCQNELFYYESIQVKVNKSGYYSFRGSGDIDPYGSIYKNKFNPLDPSENLFDQDYARYSNIQFKFDILLNVDMVYVLVVTTFDSKETGKFLIVVLSENKVTLERLSTPVNIQLIYSSKLTDDSPTYYRDCQVPQCHYETLQIHVNTMGLYVLWSENNIKAYGYIYKNDFNPLKPSENLLLSHDGPEQSSCVIGDQCNFYIKGIGLILDDILRDELQLNTVLNNQSFSIKLSAGLTIVMFIAGLTNSVLSFITFQSKDSQQVGCGMYLVASSITSLLTIIMFIIKFWFVVLTRINVSTSLSVLRGGCVSIEPILKLFLYLDGWLNACVAVERAILIFKGVNFDKKKSKSIARRTILILPFCIFGTLIHEFVFRRLFEYETASDTNMAMTNNKTHCFTCNKDKITYPCEGCLKSFCLMDLTKHRQILNEELHHIINDYNQFKQRFSEQKPKPHDLSLINQINQWEIDSIIKIQQKARDCREIVIKSSQTCINDIEKKFNDLSEQIKQLQRENEFNEINLNYLRNELIQIREELNNPPKTSIIQDFQLFINDVPIIPLEKKPKFNKWNQNAITVASENGPGQKLNQFNCPYGIFIDKKKNIFIADYLNHRVVEWKCNAKEGKVVAGGNKEGNRIDQLNRPTDVIVDQQTHSIIIADQGNRRVIQWLNQKQQILIHNIDCFGLAMDKHEFLYVSNYTKNEVRRWKMSEYNNEGIVVAGGNGKGNQLNQLNSPGFIFVDEVQSVYVADRDNYRVMKWIKGAKEGKIVAGGNLNQLFYPRGIIVDYLGQIYVADFCNHRVIRWCGGKVEGEIVVGGNGKGNQSNELYGPSGLSFDDEGNLYVADYLNHRIQKFEIILVYTRIIINDVHTKITDNSKIGPDKIATNAYNDSIGSNPPDANNIMKYIIDINRYYMELVLNEVQMKSID